MSRICATNFPLGVGYFTVTYSLYIWLAVVLYRQRSTLSTAKSLWPGVSAVSCWWFRTVDMCASHETFTAPVTPGKLAVEEQLPGQHQLGFSKSCDWSEGSLAGRSQPQVLADKRKQWQQLVVLAVQGMLVRGEQRVRDCMCFHLHKNLEPARNGRCHLRVRVGVRSMQNRKQTEEEHESHSGNL